MTTARAVIKTSLRKLRVVAEGEEPSAQQITDGLEVLNNMLSGMKARGGDLEFEDIALTDDIPVPREHIESCGYLLAKRYNSEFGGELPPEVAQEAERSERIFQAYYSRYVVSPPDKAIQRRLSRYSRGYNINTDR